MSDSLKRYKGTIVKGIGGFYYIDSEDGYFECRARGNFRKEKVKPLVGDNVIILYDETTKLGAVDEILPRKNILLRPPVANITQTAIIIASANPKPNLYLVDKVIASNHLSNVEPIICINKTDIENGDEIGEIYKNAGYRVVLTSAETGENVDVLEDMLKNNITAFVGNSGVGKSSLLNCIIGRESFETGEVSQRAERGKHTTRHSELVKLDNGGYIIDTPGFGSLDISLLNPTDCAELFREFEPYIGKCRFLDCIHNREPDCAVVKAVTDGKISSSRYESYKKLIEELKNNR